MMATTTTTLRGQRFSPRLAAILVAVAAVALIVLASLAIYMSRSAVSTNGGGPNQTVGAAGASTDVGAPVSLSSRQGGNQAIEGSSLASSPTYHEPGSRAGGGKI